MLQVKKGNKVPYNGTLLNQKESQAFLTFIENRELLEDLYEYVHEKNKLNTFNSF